MPTTTISPTIYRSPLEAPPIEPSVVVAGLRRAAQSPWDIAVVDGASGEMLTRCDVAARSAALAAGLRARGVGRGDLVAIAMPNCAWWLVAALGVWRAGAAVEPLSPLWTAEESARVLAGAAPRVAIAFAPLAARVVDALQEAGVEADVFAVGDPVDGTIPIEALLALTSHADVFAEPELAPDDLAALPFSSGTSGLPKGVRLTHGNLTAAGAHAAATLSTGGALDEDAVLLAGAAFFHSMGIGLHLTPALLTGARLVTVPLPELELTLRLAAEHRATHMAVAPPLFDALAGDPLVDEHDLSSVRVAVTGGAHVDGEVEERVAERLGCLARQGYGATEATCTIAASLIRASTPGTVGWLVPGTEARLVDPRTGADAAPGEEGELWIRGPQVMAGYHDDPETTAHVLTPDGWLRTGDLVAIRDDGQLEIRDRLKELIKVKGASVAPAEVELVLRKHPAVRDACVVGVPDAESGEAPIAFVLVDGPAEPAELLAFVGERLAGYKRPREAILVDELPRLPTGKMRRQVMRERARATAGV
jgi:acyl-CoA synthetase (AMP-forming)/AMP-acid ligase II